MIKCISHKNDRFCLNFGGGGEGSIGFIYFRIEIEISAVYVCELAVVRVCSRVRPNSVPQMSRECPAIVPRCPARVQRMSRDVPRMSSVCPAFVPRCLVVSSECPAIVPRVSRDVPRESRERFAAVMWSCCANFAWLGILARFCANLGVLASENENKPCFELYGGRIGHQCAPASQ